MLTLVTSAARARALPPTSLDDLIAQQKVKPVAIVDELAALWPVNDDPDALVAAERKARRASAR